jgi:hypothetical protein
VYGVLPPFVLDKCAFYKKSRETGEVSNLFSDRSCWLIKTGQYRENGREILEEYRQHQDTHTTFIRFTGTTEEWFQFLQTPYGKIFKAEDCQLPLHFSPAKHELIGGINVNSACQSTSHPTLYAIGECANWFGIARPKGFGNLQGMHTATIAVNHIAMSNVKTCNNQLQI